MSHKEHAWDITRDVQGTSTLEGGQGMAQLKTTFVKLDCPISVP